MFRGLLSLGAAISAPAFGSVASENLCGSPGAATQLYPTSQSLESAAEAAGKSLGGGAADSDAAALRALDVTSSSAEKPSARALAEYCSVAGEIMRLSVNGSQRQAQMYLETAFRESRAARLPGLTALTAYRLGVVSISGAPLSGTRGSASPRRNGGQIVGRLRAAEAVNDGSGEVCSALAQVSGSEADSSFSMLALDCAARLALESKAPAVSALATLRFGRFALDWADSSDDPQALIDAARDKTLAAIPVAETIPEPRLRTELLGRLAQTAIDLGAAADPRLASVPAALRSAAPGDSAASSSAAAIEARMALAGGDLARARTLIESAILFESARPVPLELPNLLLLLSKADPARRQEHVSAAYLALQNLRPNLPRLDPLTEESMFALHMRRVFESAADAQLQLADSIGSEAGVETAQQIVEAFREAELQSAVGSECLPPRSAITPGDLASNEILLYPLLFDDRVELIYVAGGGGSRAEFRRLPANRSTNKREVAKLVDTLKIELTLGTGDGWRAPAKQLYDILIKPIEPQLKDGSTLAIIPDGALRGTPFAALISDDGRYLIQRTALTVAPALAYSQPGSRRTNPNLRIVAASLARKVSLPAGTFIALSGTKAEAQIAASNGHPGTLVPDFTREQLVTALSTGDIDVLHLATHAAFNGRSDRAFIVANGEVIRLSELRDLLSQNRARGELLGLLVLSACETAVGDDESSMGLAGAAVQAGALSAIASLWQVDDAGTAELMRQFYRNYSAGTSRAQSLRQAQLALISGGGAQSDPYVWAAFTLLGAWR